jgi:large-conductance mechanosensitive channel
MHKLILQNDILRIVSRFVFIIVLLGLGWSASAATLNLSPSTGTYNSGQTFTTTVRAVPGGDSVNAVEATLGFDPSQLSVVSVDKNGSVFSLWTTEPTFSNTAGTITFGGGSPQPFTTSSTVVNVTFRVIGEGDAGVSFAEASVLAADGLGTDVYAGGSGGQYTLAQATAPTPSALNEESAPTETSDPTSGDAIIFGDPPRAPEIGSPVFLEAAEWYSSVVGQFRWSLPFDVTAIAVEISDDPNNVPHENEGAIIDPPIEDFTVNADNALEGEQYVSISFQNQVGWGAVTNRLLRIDTTPPEPFSIEVRPGNDRSAFPTLLFSAEDTTSGIDRYDVTVGTNEPETITPEQAQLGYLLRDLEDGTYSVTVVAHDLAGNTREAASAALVTAGWVKPFEAEESRSLLDYLTFVNLLICFLIVALGLMSVYVWYEKKTLKIKEDKLRRETREIQDQMEKIFSALRDAIYDQINHITKRKRLSQNEKEAVEGLTQALEVSETLIEKEITDVKAILK